MRINVELNPSMRNPKFNQSIIRAVSLLSASRYEGEVLRLRDLCARTHLSKTTVHRLLGTLVHTGLVEQVGEREYRARIKPLERVPCRIGYAAQRADSSFSQTVTESIRRSALLHGADLVLLNNRYSPRVALENARVLIREGVDLVLEFQTYLSVAPEVSRLFLDAGIPLIAIDIPHPGATFFGANNYEAGLVGGRALGKWAKRHWDGRVDEVLLFEERIAGALPCSRVAGMLAGIQESLPDLDSAKVRAYDGKGTFSPSLEAARQHLRRLQPQRTLVCATNDPSVLGAVQAFEECGRADMCGAMGQNADPEARTELRRPGSPLVGTVAYFPEKYGDFLIPLALAILAQKPAPSAVFTRHELITPANVNRVYPIDGQAADRAGDLLADGRGPVPSGARQGALAGRQGFPATPSGNLL